MYMEGKFQIKFRNQLEFTDGFTQNMNFYLFYLEDIAIRQFHGTNPLNVHNCTFILLLTEAIHGNLNKDVKSNYHILEMHG